MGCSSSKVKEVEKVDTKGISPEQRKQWLAVKEKRKKGEYMLQALPDDFALPAADVGDDAVPARDVEQLFGQIPISTAATYITVSAKEKLYTLWVYPDQNWSQFPASRLVRGNMNADDPKKWYWKFAENEALPADAPDWKSLRCQFKEFDSLDDLYKPWHETDGKINGVMKVDCASSCAAWVTLSPHVYQHRWVLPDGRRAVSLLDAANGIPVRIWEAAKKDCGSDPKKLQKFSKKLLECLERGYQAKLAIEKLQEAMTKDGGEVKIPEEDEITEALKSITDGFEIDAILEQVWMPWMNKDDMGMWQTVWELDPRLGKIIAYMSEVEDAIMRNWFEVAVDAELDVDTWYFAGDDKTKQKPENVGGLVNWARKKVLDAGNDKADELLEDFKTDLYKVNKGMLKTYFGFPFHDDSGDMVKKLYPDLKEWSGLLARSIDAELIGVRAKVDKAEKLSTPEMKAKLEEWEKLDERPLNERRKLLYEEASKTIGEGAKDKSEKAMKELSMKFRVPLRVERYYFLFRFLNVFPMQTSDKPFRRPKSCKLVLWPERHYDLKIEIDMEPFYMKDGGKDQVREESDAFVDKILSGEDEIGDAEKDPRAEWGPYDNDEFRGFSVTHKVALDIPYAFHYVCDGKVMLGAKQPIKPTTKKTYYRKAIFSTQCRPYTINPLKAMGVAI